jgi:hypothetical protein
VASFVKFLVVFALYLAVGLRRNHGNFARLLPGDQDPLVGVEALVGEQNVSVQLRQQYIGPFQIAGLSAGEMKSNGIAEGIDGGVNLGAQPALAAPDGLLAAPFFSAPALC